MSKRLLVVFLITPFIIQSGGCWGSNNPNERDFGSCAKDMRPPYHCDFPGSHYSQSSIVKDSMPSGDSLRPSSGSNSNQSSTQGSPESSRKNGQ